MTTTLHLQRRSGPRTVAKTPLLLLAALLTALVVAGCSAGRSLDTADSGGDQGGGVAERGDDRADVPERGAPPDGSGGGKDAAGRPELAPPDQAFIKTGSVTLRSRDVEETIAEVKARTAAVGGFVEQEYTDTDSKGNPEQSSIVVRVPVDAFDTTYDKFKQLGTLAFAEQSSTNVTTEIADVDSRVENAKQVIQRLRDLYARADTLGAIIQLESELAEREADLEALQAQQKALHGQADLSTIAVEISEPENGPKDDDRSGFVDGIVRGWDALVTFLSGTLTVVGLVLPFLGLFLVVGAAVYVVVRRFTPRRAPVPSE